MQRSASELSVIPIAAMLVASLLWSQFSAKQSEDSVIPEAVAPDFSAIRDVKLKKQTFFEFMLPMIQQANDAVTAERVELTRIAEKISANRNIDQKEGSFISMLAKRYRVKEDPLADDAAMSRLLDRVNTIPASLVLAQAANESAWGTARFARKGNNYFGIWCWAASCGLIPNRRDQGATHEVATFESIRAGVDYYLLTLNSHPAYRTLRTIRAKLNADNQPITGKALAEGLTRYSERGAAYVEEIRAMIRINKLESYN